MIDDPRTAAESLTGSIVHVWMVDLGPSVEKRTPQSRDAQRAASREKSRRILGGYLDCPPEAVTIERIEGGKPVLPGSSNDGLSFSLSHSDAAACLAVAVGRAVGVDVERVRADVDALGIAGRFFTVREADALRSLHPSERIEAFFRTWARKEAYVKGLGEAVPAGLKRFVILVGASGRPRVASTEFETTGRSTWLLRDLEAPTGYVAALAVEGEIDRVVYFTY